MRAKKKKGSKLQTVSWKEDQAGRGGVVFQGERHKNLSVFGINCSL